jgi:hypothetical protein
MREEDKVNRAHKIDETAGRTREAQRAIAQGRENLFDRKLRRQGDTSVMPSKGVQPMRVRSGNQRLSKPRCYSFCAAIRIEEANVKMTEFDGVETIDFGNQSRANGTAKNIERMWRNGVDGVPTLRSEPSQVFKILYRGDLFGSHVQHNDVRAAQAHLGCGNKQNAHCGRIREHFLSIEHGVVKRDGEYAESKRARAFQQLVRGIIYGVLRIIERVDVQIHLDPIFSVARLPRRSFMRRLGAHARARASIPIRSLTSECADFTGLLALTKCNRDLQAIAACGKF